MYRLRDVMESYLEQLKKFEPSGHVSGDPAKPRLPKAFKNYSMVRLFVGMAFLTAILSWIGGFGFF